MRSSSPKPTQHDLVLSAIACLQSLAMARMIRFGSNANEMAKLTRIPLIINFVLLLALLGPGSSHELYAAEKRAGITGPIALAFQIWVVGSTLFVTGLFARRLLRGQSLRPTNLDWSLFLTWWAVLDRGLPIRSHDGDGWLSHAKFFRSRCKIAIALKTPRRSGTPYVWGSEQTLQACYSLVSSG